MPDSLMFDDVEHVAKTMYVADMAKDDESLTALKLLFCLAYIEDVDIVDDALFTAYIEGNANAE